jgi:hypothetical protein
MRSFWNCFLVGLFVSLIASPTGAQSKKGAGAAASSASSATSAAAAPSSTAAFESQMLAFGALDHIAQAIATEACSQTDAEKKLIINDKTTVVIYDQTSFATLQSFEAFIANVKVLVAAYNTLIPSDAKDPKDPAKPFVDWKSFFHQLHEEYESKAKSVPSGNAEEKKNLRDIIDDLKRDEYSMTFAVAPTEPFGAATSLLSAIAVSSNTETAGSITIPDSAMAVALTRELNKPANCPKSPIIVYPPLFGHGSSSDFSSEDIQLQIEKLDYIRKKAHEFADKENTAFLVAHPGAAATQAVPATATTPAIPAKPATAGPNNAILTGAVADIDGLYDSFMNSLLQVNSGTGIIGSASVIQGYQLATLLAGRKAIDEVAFSGENIPKMDAVPGAYVLLASVVAAGGTERVHKTFWRALTVGDKITYSGGAVVNVALWKATDKSPIYYNELRYRSPFMKMKPPADVTGVDSGDNLPPPTAKKK